MTDPLTDAAATPAAGADFYAALASENLGALWQVMGDLVTPQPSSPCRPVMWRYTTVRPRLLQAADIISAEAAERRVLVLENPGLPGSSSVTTSLYAGLQIVMPGEVAPAHRHTQTALRFVLESAGGTTSVDGRRTVMEFGDFVITPNWAWHEHANDTAEPVIWLDGLDIPLVRFLDASFAQRNDGEAGSVAESDSDHLARYGYNLLPLDGGHKGHTSPLFNYPYSRSREALQAMSRNGDIDPCHGYRMKYTNPLDGKWAIPTIGTCLQWLPAGFQSRGRRSTDATVHVVVEGSGTSDIGGEDFSWQPRDVFVAPSWCPVRHRADSDAVLFTFSDRPVQEVLGLWREQVFTDPD